MAFNFACKPGDDFFIRDHRFVISNVASPKAFTVLREEDGQAFAITDDGTKHEIAAGVSVSVGLRGQGNLARIALEGDRAIPIDRGENYRALGGHKPR